MAGPVPDFSAPEVDFSIKVVRECMTLAREIQDTLVTPALKKQDRSPVTVADFAIQAITAHTLISTFPNDPLVAEESATALRMPDNQEMLSTATYFVGTRVPEATADQVLAWIDHGSGDPTGRFWVLDPIDGTKGFLRNAQYAVALALIENGEVVTAALGCPRLSLALPRGRGDVTTSGDGSLLIAVRGRGCWQIGRPDDDPIPVRVSEVSDPRRAIVIRSVESGHTDVEKMERLLKQLNVSTPALPVDSQAKFSLLAAGKGDILARLPSPAEPEYREKIWDQAPGALIAEEAGGRVTDILGEALDFTSGRRLERNLGVVATNKRLHDLFLNALNR